MKKMRNILLATIIGFSSAASLAACEGIGGGNALTARDTYAMTAVSSMAFLSEKGEGSALALAMAEMATRPDYVTDNDARGIKNCLDAFDGLIAGGGIKHTVTENTSTDESLAVYRYEMDIFYSNTAGDDVLCTLYFNEVSKNTYQDIEDGETEESTRFFSIAVMDGERFYLEGTKEVEYERNEVETHIEFKTYKLEANGDVDLENYVLVSQSTEDNEAEYEYEFYRNGNFVQKLELEYEQKKGGVEVEFQAEDFASGARSEREYRIRKKTSGEGFTVTFEWGGKKNTINVTKVENGYEFTYGNGFSEVIS